MLPGYFPLQEIGVFGNASGNQVAPTAPHLFHSHKSTPSLLLDSPERLCSRIILISCDDIAALNGSILQVMDSDKRSFVNYGPAPCKIDQKALVLGWFDRRDVRSRQLESLLVNYFRRVKKPMSKLNFKWIENQKRLDSVLSDKRFTFLDDCFDTTYVTFRLEDVYEKSFLGDIYAQLSKFGSLYDFSPVDGVLNVYKCRFDDVRCAFEVRKLTTLNINKAAVAVNGSLIDVFEHNNRCPVLDIKCHKIDIENFKLPVGEWKKYQMLKHRRLAKFPFKSPFIPKQNLIDIDRVLQGRDKRTTLLIRNIPNKMTFDQLKSIIDKTSRGEYSFLYLRIDFENHCNVGYAFISFANPLSIVSFYLKRHNSKWPFKSDKICQLAYAQIQGRDKLILKFQHSTVLRENPEYRPRLYTTSGVRKGQEIAFPAYPK